MTPKYQSYEEAERQYNRQKFWRKVIDWSFPWVALLFLCVIVLMTGCAADPYWRHDKSPVPIEAVVEVDNIEVGCNASVRSWGCTLRNESTALILIAKSLPADLRACVIAHEKRHAAGDIHDNRPNYSIDCGNGTFWYPPRNEFSFASH